MTRPANSLLVVLSLCEQQRTYPWSSADAEGPHACATGASHWPCCRSACANRRAAPLRRAIARVTRGRPESWKAIAQQFCPRPWHVPWSRQAFVCGVLQEMTQLALRFAYTCLLLENLAVRLLDSAELGCALAQNQQPMALRVHSQSTPARRTTQQQRLCAWV